MSRTNGMENAVLLATLGAALAVLGPGSYSVDVKLFGRKRILIPNHWDLLPPQKGCFQPVPFSEFFKPPFRVVWRQRVAAPSGT
jgi:hypothetical protein